MQDSKTTLQPNTSRPPIFSPERIAEINASLKVQLDDLFKRLRERGIMYKKIPTMFIRRKDVITYLKFSPRQATRIMAEVRERLGKKTRDRITIQDFCRETGADNFMLQRLIDD